jgi:DNA polymerase III alpha subunit
MAKSSGLFTQKPSCHWKDKYPDKFAKIIALYNAFENEVNLRKYLCNVDVASIQKLDEMPQQEYLKQQATAGIDKTAKNCIVSKTSDRKRRVMLRNTVEVCVIQQMNT